MSLQILALVVFAVNVLFGCWRARQRFFSLKWFLAIYLPVIVVLVLRFFSDVGFELRTIPVIVVVYVLGQWTGRFLCRKFRKKQKRKQSVVK